MARPYEEQIGNLVCCWWELRLGQLSCFSVCAAKVSTGVAVLESNLALLRPINYLLYDPISLVQVHTGMCSIGPQEDVPSVIHCSVISGREEREVTG